MAFIPLPGLLVRDFLTNPNAVVVELGSGNSLFTEIIKSYTQVIQLDLAPAYNSSFTQVMADAAEIPFKKASVDILLVPNLWRHLNNRLELLDYWQGFLSDSGVIYVLEDDTESSNIAESNYQELQKLLCKIGPSWRGELISFSDGVDSILSTATEESSWCFGSAKNSYQVNSLEKLIAMLCNLPDKPNRLIDSINEHGLSYGQYWWARYSREMFCDCR
ncbi:MAG: class I SAM-dependent methyltransferase [bacterium]|nr:class I SAM-dependent methyltransferase [bacterium]